MNRRMQRTIAQPVSFDGVGLHTGEKGRVTFRPAAADRGVRFIRADLPGRPEVMVRPENAHFEPAAGRRTILREGNVQIHTMEHILAAPGIAALCAEYLTQLHSVAERPAFRAALARHLAEYGTTRGAVSELAGSLLNLAAG